MSRSFRFVRFDEALMPLDEVSLKCLDGADALTVGWTLGWRVEVWDGARPLGVVGEGALMTAQAAVSNAPAPIAPIADEPEPPALAAVLEPPAMADPLPVGDPSPIDEFPVDDGSRPYNPFRRGAWRRRAAS